jgi:hypothetical protein
MEKEDRGSFYCAPTVSINPSALPEPTATLWTTYGAAHDRPVLALSRPVGTFEVDLTTFRVGMPVMCKHEVKNRVYGWFPAIINRIVGRTADVDYDDGTYGYNVPFRWVKAKDNNRIKRVFKVSPCQTRQAIVLSIPHAQRAVEDAFNLVQAVRSEWKLDTASAGVFSTHCNSRPSMPPAIFSSYAPVVPHYRAPNAEEDDEVEFVMEKIGTSRGSQYRPIVL